MEGIATLVRIYRTRLNDARRALADLNRERDIILGESARLVGQVAAEKLIAATSWEANTAFANFLNVMTTRRAAMNFQLNDVEGRLGEANDYIATLFRELKKYELTQAQRELEKTREADRREQIELDELGLDMYRRREAAR
ncbi:MAG: flagellar FliJ family protein [Proteobacteria bacterium]|nr:flagellar FliJ family protein [Pseudomonadota bacterium]MDA1356134.1 flagellar FliJ family protein [Pseudomonadota bacterium]